MHVHTDHTHTHTHTSVLQGLDPHLPSRLTSADLSPARLWPLTARRMSPGLIWPPASAVPPFCSSRTIRSSLLREEEDGDGVGLVSAYWYVWVVCAVTSHPPIKRESPHQHLLCIQHFNNSVSP